MAQTETVPQRVRRTIVSGIERAPASASLLRIYNTVLRTFGGPYRAKTYFGATMLCDPGDLLQHCVLHFGVWEPNTSAVIERILNEGDVCADVGANVGYDALLASCRVGPTGKVIAIEASPAIFRLMERNLGENRPANIRVVNKAVSDRVGTLSLYSGPKGNLGQTTTLVERNFAFEATVATAPLDAILTEEERAGLKLIKMDIEGAEGPVMRRLFETLHLYRDDLCVLVEISPSPEWPAIFRDMQKAGFAAYAIHNDYTREYYLRERHSLVPLEPLSAAPSGQMDVLFTKEASPVLGTDFSSASQVRPAAD
jgi:FkbM family methyltransferase